jgi:hypothetical protein
MNPILELKIMITTLRCAHNDFQYRIESNPIVTPINEILIGSFL